MARPRAQTSLHPTHPLAGGTVRSWVSLGLRGTHISQFGMETLLQVESWEQEMEGGCSPRHRLLPSLLGDQASPARPGGTNMEPSISDPALEPRAALAPAPGGPPRARAPPACLGGSVSAHLVSGGARVPWPPRFPVSSGGTLERSERSACGDPAPGLLTQTPGRSPSPTTRALDAEDPHPHLYRNPA